MNILFKYSTWNSNASYVVKIFRI